MLLSRHRLQLLLAQLWWRLACELLQLDKAARMLQGGFHMGQLRYFRRSAVVAARRIQACWRGTTVRMEMRLLHLAVLKLQRWHRRHVERDRLLAHLQQLRMQAHCAATLIQRHWRGIAARRQHGPELQRRRLARTRRKSGPKRGHNIHGGRFGLHAFSRSSLRGAAKLRSVQGKLERSASAVVQGLSRPDWRTGTQVQPGRMDSGKLAWMFPRMVSSTLDVSVAIPVSTSNLRHAMGGGGTHVDSQILLAMLLSRGVLSTSPHAPPWSQEFPGQSDIEAVQARLKATVPVVEVKAVFRVEIATASSVAYNGVRRTLGPEKLLWHGTTWEAAGNIAQNGFNRAYVGRHGTKLGRGTYFAEDASYAMRFCSRGPSRAIFLAGVLPGRYCRGEEGLVEPPPAPDNGARFDSTVDDPEQPRIFCVFRDFQALPLYLVEVA